MRHPYRETADILRDLARIEGRDRWADRERQARLRAQARELNRLARIDENEHRREKGVARQD